MKTGVNAGISLKRYRLKTRRSKTER